MLVWRGAETGREWLLLHRALEGPDYEGDWAWSSPGGRLEEGEDPSVAARRELREETGLELECRPAPVEHDLVAFFVAEAPPKVQVRLSPEHDRYEWATTDEARARCLPEWVGTIYERVR